MISSDQFEVHVCTHCGLMGYYDARQVRCATLRCVARCWDVPCQACMPSAVGQALVFGDCMACSARGDAFWFV